MSEHQLEQDEVGVLSVPDEYTLRQIKILTAIICGVTLAIPIGVAIVILRLF